MQSINPKASYEILEKHLKRYEHSHANIKQLFKIAREKQSNLIVSIDETDPSKVLQIITEVGKHVVCVKLHYDIIRFDKHQTLVRDWNNFYNHLVGLKNMYNFLIFEDRKFMDIGNTVYKQYSKVQSIYEESLDFTNACVTSGQEIVDSMREYHTLKNQARPGCCLLLLAQMSSKGNTFGEENIKLCKKAANSDSGRDFVGGYICQSKSTIESVFGWVSTPREDLVYFTPGVHLEKDKDTKGQQYRTVSDAIERDGCDFIIVGRGITSSLNIEEAADMYRQEGWNSYLNKISKK
jgi:orotidine-5'-phosphate decarboxylase